MEPHWREELRALLAADTERTERESRGAAETKTAAGQAQAGCQETLNGQFYPALVVYLRDINTGNYGGSLSPLAADVSEASLSFWRRHDSLTRSTIRFSCRGGQVVAVEEHLPPPGTPHPGPDPQPGVPVIFAQLHDRLNRFIQTAIDRFPR